MSCLAPWYVHHDVVSKTKHMPLYTSKYVHCGIHGTPTDRTMSCCMDTSGGVYIGSKLHAECTIRRIFTGTAYGTTHEHSTRDGKHHGIIAYNIAFHRVHHGVAHVIENTIMYHMA